MIPKKILEKVRKVKWQEIARRGRNHAVLFIDYVTESFRQGIVEKKMKWGFSPRTFRQFDGGRWMSEEDVRNYYKCIEHSEKKEPGYLLRKAKEYEECIVKIRKWGIKVSKINFKKLTSKKLKNIFKKYVELYMESNGFIYNYLFINDFLAKDLSGMLLQKQPTIEKQTKDLYVLFSPLKKSGARKEKEMVVILAKKIKKDDVRIGSAVWHKLVKKHLQLFAHLNRYVYYGRSYIARDIEKRVRALLKNQKLERVEQELKNSEYDQREIKNIIAFYKFDKPTILKIQAARYMAYVPNFWDETFIYLVHHLMPLFQEIARRVGVRYEELIEMRFREVYEFLEKGKKASAIFKKELAGRYQNSATILVNGKIIFLTGQSLRAYYKQEKWAAKRELSHFSKIKELKGQAASVGKAFGRVCIIHSVEEIKKVKRGDILVTAATTPMHVPAMERAKAIVTDEGGLLCHAAIVSRELGIPCIIGTKIATKALKDGQFIEVDAHRGVVRILKSR